MPAEGPSGRRNADSPPKLRDGVDVYVGEAQGRDVDLIFVFLSTRKRIRVRVRKEFTLAVAQLDGHSSITEIADNVSIDESQLREFVKYLASKNVVAPEGWFEALPFEGRYKELVEKQLYFLMDVADSAAAVADIQKRIRKATVAICGLGSTGSWVFFQLLQMGFERFVLLDFKGVSSDMVSRHALPNAVTIETSKVEFYSSMAQRFNPASTVTTVTKAISTDSTVSDWFADCDLIVNCADEPYVGYTNICLSRYCLKERKILVAAGGFDAHLGCLGELIIPYSTACADCYSTYFKESLKNWKPATHPVEDRSKGFGGLAGLSVFSASTAVVSILRCFLDPDWAAEQAYGRGEFKFDDYTVDSFAVPRDPNCMSCGNDRRTA